MKNYEIIEKIRNNINEALEEAYERGKQDGFESNTAYRHGYYDGQKDAYKEREATERHWGNKDTQQTDEIRVGDEVLSDIGISSSKGLVLGICNGKVRILWQTDLRCTSWTYEGTKSIKTGRHFPQILEVLQLMRETT